MWLFTEWLSYPLFPFLQRGSRAKLILSLRREKFAHVRKRERKLNCRQIKDHGPGGNLVDLGEYDTFFLE